MRKAVTLTVLVGATAVTAMLASPSQPASFTGIDVQHLTFANAAAMMERTAVVASLLFVWLIGAVLLTIASPRDVRYSSIELRVSPLHCAVVGLVAFTSFILSAVLFSYLVPYVVGMPLLIALGVIAILTKIYGMIAVFHAIGTRIAGARTIQQLTQRRWLRGDLALVVTGLVILGAVRLIPVVGPIIWGAASLLGIGVALATKFGRREPWFLTWRTAELPAR